MALQMRPLHSAFGVEILGIDVRSVDDAAFGEIRRALDAHSVLLFRGQKIDDEEQIAFSERFGPLEKTIRSIAQQERDLPQISNLANVDADNQLIPRGDKRNLFNAATRCGTATARSSACRRWRRSCPRARCRPRAARPSSPACAWATSGCRRR